MAEQEFEIRKALCVSCKKEFDSKWANFIGKMRQLSAYCPECVERQRIEAQKKAEDERLKTEAAIKKQREAYVDAYLSASNIPTKYAGCTFANFISSEQSQPLKLCQEYVKNYLNGKRDSAVLYSEKSWGVGKTHLVCAIANAIMISEIKPEAINFRIRDDWDSSPPKFDIKCHVYFTTEPDLFRRIQATYNIKNGERQSHETEDDVIRHITEVPLLIIDDIGKEDRQDNKFIQRMLFAIIDGRYREMLPIILTANLSPAKLAMHLGGDSGNMASHDRLLEMCQQQFIKVEGKSYRPNLRQGNVD